MSSFLCSDRFFCLLSWFVVSGSRLCHQSRGLQIPLLWVIVIMQSKRRKTVIGKILTKSTERVGRFALSNRNESL